MTESNARTIEDNEIEQATKEQLSILEEYKEMYSKINEHKINKVLQEYFSIKQIKPHQLECLKTLKQFKHVLNIMPTGGGKSLVYQIMPLLTGGMSIVISPLLSLIQDQIESLRNKNIIAHSINSSCSKQEKSNMFEKLRNETENNIQVLFLTPETATSDYFIPFLKELYNKKRICLFAIDEAHCISTWGCDFRKTYRNLKKVLEICPLVRVYACTATATQRVSKDIIMNLNLNTKGREEEMIVIKDSFNRTNLKYIIIYSDLVNKPKSELVHDIIAEDRNKGKTGIVYCFKRNVCEEITKELRKRGIQAMSYHAGLSATVRKSTQDKWIQGKVQILVATVAFGMGIDRASVSFIIHYNIPKSITNYYQESGRAGRDGVISYCYLIYTLEDVSCMSFIIKKSYGATDNMNEDKEKRYQHELYNLEDVNNLCVSNKCIRLQILNHFDEEYQPPKNVARRHKEKEEETDPYYCCSFCYDRSGSIEKINKVMDLYDNKNGRTQSFKNYYEEENQRKSIVEQMNNYDRSNSKKRNYESSYDEEENEEEYKVCTSLKKQSNKKIKPSMPVFTPSSLISDDIRKKGIHKVMEELEKKEQLYEEKKNKSKEEKDKKGSGLFSSVTYANMKKNFQHTAFKIPRKL